MERVEQSSSCPTLARMKKLVVEMEQLSPMISSHLVEQVCQCLRNLPSKLSEEESLQAWNLSYSVWNSCVDIANNLQPGQELEEDHARLRQVASDLLLLAGDIDGIDSCLFKIATFFYRTGVIWHKVKNFEMASVCYEKATELLSKDQEEKERNATPKTREEQQFMFDLLVARSETAWELSHKALACSLLGRAKGLLVVLPEQHLQLAHHFLKYGTSLLTKEDTESRADSIKYMEQAFEICSNNVNPPETQKDTNISLKMKILRYLAAGHLQMENYESVLKCLAVLKSAPDHPSTFYLAVKALAGLDRYGEAEKELFSLIRQTDASVEACMSGIEIVLQDQSRLEAGKRAFLTVQSRHPSNKWISVRILEYLLRHLPDVDVKNKTRVEVALDIATNEKVLASVTSVDNGGLHIVDNDVSSERGEQQCIHTIFWNCGSEYFDAKQYEICIRLFETSMLYLPRDSNSNVHRAKSLRVLCLCRLALMEHDRANEYVIEAERIDPNIACAFLKFKIYLQTEKESEAAEQVDKMLLCPDFEPGYLSLASHEAMACNCIKVAISALSRYLSLSQEKRSSTGTKDVILIRNIVNIGLQDSKYRMEALEHLKDAQTRLADVGSDIFFGSGSLGQQEANWFAATAWNQGLLAIKNKE